MMTKSSKIVEPRSTDILCGRVKNTFNHEGNQIFRLVVESHLDSYKRAGSRVERSNLFKVVLKELQKTGCRFLRFDEATQEWEELDMKATRNKISHAFRDRYPPFNFNRTAKFRRKQYEMEEQLEREASSFGDSEDEQLDQPQISHQYRGSSTSDCLPPTPPTSSSPETPAPVYSNNDTTNTRPKKCSARSLRQDNPSLCDMLSVDMMGSMAYPDRTISSSSAVSRRNRKTAPNLQAIRGFLSGEGKREEQEDDAFLDQINKLDLEAFYHHNEVEQREFQQRLLQQNHTSFGPHHNNSSSYRPLNSNFSPHGSFSSGMVEL